MSLVQVDLPRISDLAARQTIDSTAAYKEFLRVRDELQAYEGSMHWKKTGAYEYLVHKKHGRHVSQGARSAETEAQLEQFNVRKQKLLERYKSLKDAVETSQRMNKAVRAGSVPSPVVDVLSALDESGLGREALVVGAPALYAYTQRSGLQADVVMMCGAESGGAEEDKVPFFVFLEMKTASPDAVEKFRHSIKGADITSEPLPSVHKIALQVTFPHQKAAQKAAPAPRPRDCLYNHEMSTLVFTCSTKERGSQLGKWASHGLLQVLNETPKFEQVVIGKTGRMAMMRTMDPRLFVAFSNKAGEASAELYPQDACRSRLQAELVSKMVDEYWVTSKLDEAELHEVSTKLDEYWALGQSHFLKPPHDAPKPPSKSVPKLPGKREH